MKKFLLLVLLVVSADAVQAQSISAGTISVGGNVGYSRNTSKNSSSQNGNATSQETTTSQFTFSPSVGYFLADNLAVGVSLGYVASRRPYTTYSPAPATVRAELDPATTLRVGPYVQYYKMISDQFGVLGTLGAGFQVAKDHAYSSNSGNATIIDFKGSGYYAELTPGIIFFPVPKFGVSASIGSLAFNRYKYDYPNYPNTTTPAGYESTSSTFGAGFGFDRLMFGGTYYFGR
ncbi:hypothetical protein AUC43_04125 [Hymenobacter sedentarius]|uniref:Outer membrane protein beta-barrel domain-containing protein n=1 Tax=Hymenobacter sedentarius TaxID=1411621 RepID=A0A0U4BCQ3_9BACT|nr:outer membrane beta-barrel protein [Hymenobacter sedentarius]ALW84347.1 hypothetical protein AUC43_04125 [Hymenobacter sedentarius]